MKTLNIISGDNWLFRETIGSWQGFNCSIGSANAGVALGVDAQFRFADRFNSLIVTPDSNDVASILLEGIPVPIEYVGQVLDFHVRTFCDARIRVRVTLSTNQNTESIKFTAAAAGRWNIARGSNLTIPDIGSVVNANVRLCFFDHNQNPIRVAVPFLYAPEDAFSSKFAASVFLSLPRVMTSADFDPEAIPNNLFYRIIEAGLFYSEYALDSLYDFEYVDEVTAALLDYSPTPSSLVDPGQVSFETAEWLAQFMGFSLDNPSLAATPWGALSAANNITSWGELESVIDPNNSFQITALSRSSNVVTATVSSHTLTNGTEIFVRDCTAGFNGTFIVTSNTPTTVSWAQTGADVTAIELGAIYESDTEWEELENFDPDFFDQTTYIAWQLEYGYQGYAAGTLQALKAAAAFNLIDTKMVTITKNFGGDPWHVRVTTKTSETPGGVDNQPAVTVLQDITRVKPAGFQYSHICTATGTP